MRQMRMAERQWQPMLMLPEERRLENGHLLSFSRMATKLEAGMELPIDIKIPSLCTAISTASHLSSCLAVSVMLESTASGKHHTHRWRTRTPSQQQTTPELLLGCCKRQAIHSDYDVPQAPIAYNMLRALLPNIAL
jgi:hypothetical protein